MRARCLVVLFAACGGSPAASSTPAGDDGAPTADACRASLTAPPAELDLDPFYAKYLDVGGLPLVSSAKVSDAAFPVACDALRHMLAKRPEVIAALARTHVRVGIIGATEQTTDMPEYADLNDDGTDWNARTRGVGATEARPLSSVGEENLLHLPGDRYAGENILVHEFGHTFFDLGIAKLSDGAASVAELDRLYQAAIAAGTFANTYAASNASEYWAEGVQDFYNANREATPADGVHGPIDTRAELETADPGLAAFLAKFLAADDWRP